MRHLRRSSVAESSPDAGVSHHNMDAVGPGGASSSSGMQQQQQGHGGRVRHRGLSAAAASGGGGVCGSRASLLGSSESQSFLRQQLQQLQQGFGERNRDHQQQQQQRVSADSCVLSGASAPSHSVSPQEAWPVGSPIEGLGALRRSLGQLPCVASRPASAAASLRLSLCEERLVVSERASQQAVLVQQQLRQQQQQMSP